MSDDAPEYRLGYDPREFNPALRIEANERLTAMQFLTLNQRLDRIEEAMMRLEKRLWLTVFGVAAAILTQAFQSFLTVVPQ